MWIKLNIDGMIFKLKIEDYKPNQDTNGNFVKASYSFIFKDIIKYEKERDEVLLSSEIDILIKHLRELLDDEMKDIVSYDCIEPDFEFIFNPKYDDIDIDMELRVYLYNPMLTCNYFSVLFNRTQIEQLYTYLSLITKRINREDEKVKQLLKEGIITK